MPLAINVHGRTAQSFARRSAFFPGFDRRFSRIAFGRPRELVRSLRAGASNITRNDPAQLISFAMDPPATLRVPTELRSCCWRREGLPRDRNQQRTRHRSPGVVGHPVESTPGKRQMREADDAYLAGAKKLQHDDLTGAEKDFQRAVTLNPTNPSYAVAVSVTHEHQVGNLVQHAAKARIAGDDKTADSYLELARAIDPESPLVLEHSGPFVRGAARVMPTGVAPGQIGAAIPPLADRQQIVAAALASPGWKIQAPVLAGVVRLTPDDAAKDFTLSGPSAEVIRNVALTYGIHAIVEDAVEPKNLKFNIENVKYDQAMRTLMEMAHVFAVPVDETTVIVADDTSANRQRLERQLEETVYLPGLANDQINELAQVVKSVFDVKQAAIQTGSGSMVIRAPQTILEPLNQTLKDLIDNNAEVMVEVKLYEVDATNTVTAGGTVPTQFNVFNVQQAANSIVNSNQALVLQAIAQGYVPAGTSNLEIALALIQLGLVQSTLASNLIGVIGGGLIQTGISASTNTTFNLGLNTSDTRTLDDVQLRVGDHQAATFREGNKYPITQSTYSSGLSTAGTALGAAGNATINGVSVSSLLQQYAGGSSLTIPQVTYEDLGITLKTTPVIEKSGRVNMLLDLKIEALSGSSLDGNPVLQSRQFSTDLTVADGESALLVSNVTKSESAAMTGFPGLSELPGFQLPLEDTLDKSNNQLVVVVTPHVVRHRSNLIAGPRIPVLAPSED